MFTREICLSNVLEDHFVAMLCKMRFESSRTDIDPHLFVPCAAGKADGEVSRSKVRILSIVDPAFSFSIFFFFSFIYFRIYSICSVTFKNVLEVAVSC